MIDLKNKLIKAKEGRDYLWDLLEKEAVRGRVKNDILAVLYKYQVELDATKHKLNNIEKTLMNPKLTKEDIENLDDALSKHITDFQAIALNIENLLRG